MTWDNSFICMVNFVKIASAVNSFKRDDFAIANKNIDFNDDLYFGWMFAMVK